MPCVTEQHVINIHNHTPGQVLVVLFSGEQQGKDLRYGTAACIAAGACARWHYVEEGKFVARAFLQETPELNLSAAVVTGKVYQVRHYGSQLFLTVWGT